MVASDDEDDPKADEHEATVSVPKLLVAPELRRPLAIVSLLMLCQQLSGKGTDTFMVITLIPVVGINAGRRTLV